LKSIFFQFGPPRILHSDNGREFVAKVILDLTKLWPGLLIINGRPRHPQSQGLVERGNAVVQQMLGKWLDTNGTKDWPSELGPVMFAINTSVAQTIKKTPFEVVFGQQP
jgi:transposase InsO family protein